MSAPISVLGPCPVCRSTEYYETETGFFVCEFGHQSQSFWEEGDEEPESHVMPVRRRLDRPSGKTKRHRVYHESDEEDPNMIRLGQVERYDYFRAFQCILIGQVDSLTRLLRLSPTYAKTVRHIWLSYVHGSGLQYEEERLVSSLPSKVGDTEGGKTPMDEKSKEPGNPQEPPQILSISFSSEIDPIWEGQPASTVKPKDASLIQANPFKGPAIKNLKLSSKHLSPSHSLIFCYIGLLHMNLPVLLADIHQYAPSYALIHSILTSLARRMASTELLPYMRAHKLIPAELLSKLGKIRSYAFYPQSIPNVEILEHETFLVVLRLSKFGYPPPELNPFGTMQRLCQELALPYCYIPMVLSMIERHGIDLSYSTWWRGHLWLVPPIVRLTATLIFFLKSHYAFDLEPRIRLESPVFSRCGLPTASQLVEIWKRRDRRLPKFERDMKEFSWENFDKYLEYCRHLRLERMTETGEEGEEEEEKGMEQQIQELLFVGLEEKTPAPSPSTFELRLYKDEDPMGKRHDEPPWMTRSLSMKELHCLSEFEKFWVVNKLDDWDGIYSDYRTLLEYVAYLIGCNVRRLMGCVTIGFENYYK